MPTMSAALHDGRGKMRVSTIDRPAFGPNDALVRVRCCGICGSDLLNYGENETHETFPGGHEVAGEIVEVGADVDSARAGQKVAVENIGHGKACLECWYCRTGQYKHCENKGVYDSGGFAEFIVRRAVGCYALPDSLSWEEAALVEPLAVAVHAVRRSQMSGGETVAVLGSGNIGLVSVAAARAMGAGRVFATARHDHQASMAKQLGADDVVSPEGNDLLETLGDVTEGRGADVTFETVGGHTSATIEQAISVTRAQGRIVVLGGFHAPLTIDWLVPLLSEQSFIFSSCYSVIDGRNDYELAIDLMDSGAVDLGQMVTHRFPLEDIQQGFETAYDKPSGSIKVQLHM